MFAYCGNNPVLRIDSSGGTWTYVVWTIIGSIDDALHFLNTIAVIVGVDTASIGASLLDMYESSPGVHHATTDCWQQYFGYNAMYDFLFDIGTDMTAVKFKFTHDGTSYVIWAWKGDYINLGAGAELGIYSGGGPHWQADTGLSFPMTLSLSYNGEEIINHSQTTWWITGFNSNYLNVSADNLSATVTIDFSGNKEMFRSFYNQYRNSGWKFDLRTWTASYTF